MPNETITNKLIAINAQIVDAKTALDECAQNIDIAQRIESANAREIEKLKRHVANLQTKDQARANPEPVVPTGAV